jgi:hypothetical protein
MKFALRVLRPLDALPASAPVPEDAIWSNVTPAGTNLALEFGASGQPVVHPLHANKIYIGYDQDGIYESTDYGATFAKVSAVDSIVGEGAIWFLRFAPDGSGMFAGHGHDSAGGRHQKILKSIDDGRTWFEASADLGWQPYDIDFDPADSSHAIVTSHSPGDGDVYESFNMDLNNGGITLASMGDTGESNSGYAYFGLTAATILFVREDDDGGSGATKRATWNGSAWSAFSDVSTQGHWHGSFQPYVDRVNSLIYMATAAGIMRSSDDGATWPDLLLDLDVASVWGYGAVLVTGLSYALGQGGEFGPNIRISTNSGSSWANGPTVPAAMVNGPRSWTVTLNPAGQLVFICNCWCAGTYRVVVTV